MLKNIRNIAIYTSLLALSALVLTSCSSSDEEEQQAQTVQNQESNQVQEVVAPTANNSALTEGECCAIDGDRIVAADTEQERGNWLSHGRDYGEQRFSPLSQINTNTISDLGLAWYADTDTNRGHEASPIVVDGRMFYTAPWSILYAVNAKTGEKLWTYDPKVDKAWGVNACCDVVNRGVAVWEGVVYLGTIDGRLEALDAVTGKVIWSTLTIDKSRPYTITGAPRVVKGKVLIGNGGAEYGVRGYISAYDAKTGEMDWRFYTVPGNPAVDDDWTTGYASATWGGGPWWEIGGGGTVWDSMAYDPELDLLYIGVGNGAPWNRSERSPAGGDNLFLSSIVALKPDTGEYVWHFQTTPGDTWDFTATQHIILADLELKGKERKVLMQAPKNGFFYVLDRETGEFISGEEYVSVTWAEGLDEFGRPVESEQSSYEGNPAGVLTFPSPFGGHNWHPSSYSKDTGLVYIPAQEIPFAFGDDTDFQYEPGRWNTGVNTATTVPSRDPAVLGWLKSVVKGNLIAWDPVNQEKRWEVVHPFPWNGGILSTAGDLVFQGNATGKLVAYNATNGEKVWEVEANTGIIAPPISYEIDGEQYIAVMAGYGGAFALAAGIPTRTEGSHYVGRMLVYRLGGSEALPPVAKPGKPAPPIALSKKERKESFQQEGEQVFHRYCSICHGAGAVGGGVLPDLRWSSATTFDQFEEIVLDGIRADRGMVGFSDVLKTKDVRAVKAYILARAHEDYKNW